MKENISDCEMLDKYIKIGAYMKILCWIAVETSTTISNNFNKYHPFTVKMSKLTEGLDQLRCDLEDDMPYEKMNKICKKQEINPLDIFYGYTNTNDINKQQMRVIYDTFLKVFLEEE